MAGPPQLPPSMRRPQSSGSGRRPRWQPTGWPLASPTSHLEDLEERAVRHLHERAGMQLGNRYQGETPDTQEGGVISDFLQNLGDEGDGLAATQPLPSTARSFHDIDDLDPHLQRQVFKEAGSPLRSLLSGRGAERLAQEVKELRDKCLRLEREKHKFQEKLAQSEEKVKELLEDNMRFRQDPQFLHPAVQRLRKMGLNTPALAELGERWAGYVLGRSSLAMEAGGYAFRTVYGEHARNGVLTEESFKSVIRYFEPTIKSDQLTRLWFFADDDGSGQLDLYEFMRMFGCNANGEISDEYYDLITMNMYRKFHSRGGIRRVYASADTDMDRKLSVADWARMLGSCNIGLSRIDLNLTKGEMTQVFQRMNTSSTGELTVIEFEAALEAVASKCYVSEIWVRDTFKTIASAIQEEGIEIRPLLKGIMEVKDFQELMQRFVPKLRPAQLDRLWKFVVTQHTEEVGDGRTVLDADTFMRIAFGHSLGVLENSSDANGPTDAKTAVGDAVVADGLPSCGTGREVLEQLATLLRNHTGEIVPVEACFDCLDPFLTPEHFHHQLVAKFGLQYDIMKTKQVFSLIDADRDGKITRYEFLSILRKLVSVPVKDSENASSNGTELAPSVDDNLPKQVNRLLNRVFVLESQMSQMRSVAGLSGSGALCGVVVTAREKQYDMLKMAYEKSQQQLREQQSPRTPAASSSAVRFADPKKPAFTMARSVSEHPGMDASATQALQKEITQFRKENMQLHHDFEMRMSMLAEENGVLREQLEAAQQVASKSRTASFDIPTPELEDEVPADLAVQPIIERSRTPRASVSGFNSDGLALRKDFAISVAEVKGKMRQSTKLLTGASGHRQTVCHRPQDHSSSVSASPSPAREVAPLPPVGPVRRALKQLAETQKHSMEKRMERLDANLVGTVVEDRFRVDSVLSFSQRIVVVRSTDLLLSKSVSLKLLFDTRQDYRKDFAYEHSILSLLAAVPHIQDVYHFSGAHAPIVFSAIELLQGQTLSQRFKEAQRSQEEELITHLEATEIADALLKGVDQCHQLNIINLGIRPDTIWLSPPLSAARIRILNWEHAQGFNGQTVGSEFEHWTKNLWRETRLEGHKAKPPKLLRGKTSEFSTSKKAPSGAFPNLFMEGVGGLYYMPMEQLYSVLSSHEAEGVPHDRWEWYAQKTGPAAKIDGQVVHWWQKGNGLVQTAEPVPTISIGRVFEVEVFKILTMVRRHNNDLGFTIGFTPTPPSSFGTVLAQDRQKAGKEAFLVGGDCAFYIRGERLAASAHDGDPTPMDALREPDRDRNSKDSGSRVIELKLGEGLRRGDRVCIVAEWSGNLLLFVNGEQVGKCADALKPSEAIRPLYGLVDLYAHSGTDEHNVRAVALTPETQVCGASLEQAQGKAAELKSVQEMVHASVDTPLGPAVDVYACALVLLQCFRGGLEVKLPPAFAIFQVAMSVWIGDCCPHIQTEHYLLSAVRDLMSERETSLSEIPEAGIRTVLTRGLKRSRFARLSSCWEFAVMLNEATGWQEMTTEFMSSHSNAVDQAERRHAAELHLQISRSAWKENMDNDSETEESSDSDSDTSSGSEGSDKTEGKEEIATNSIVAVWDLRPFVLCHSHLTRAVQVLTTWNRRQAIRLVAVTRFAGQIPEQLQSAFVSCFNDTLEPGAVVEHPTDNAQVAGTIRPQKKIFSAARQEVMWRALGAAGLQTGLDAKPVLVLEDVLLPTNELPSDRFPLRELMRRHLLWLAAHFVARLNLDTSLEIFDGKVTRVGDDQGMVQELASAISRSRVLQHLSLRSSNLGETGGLELASAILSCPQLQWLNLADNDLGPKAAKEMVQAAAAGNNLTYLDLSRNHIGDYGAKKLSKPLAECSCLRELRLGQNNIGPEGGAALSESLFNNSALTELHLGHNNLTLPSALSLFRVTAATLTLRSLNLEYNAPWPAYEDSESLVLPLVNCLGCSGDARDSLAKVSCLTELSLRHCNIRSATAAKLFAALIHNTVLERLNMSWNGIRQVGAVEIAQMLAEPRTALQALDLRDNQLGTQDAIGQAFVGIFRHSPPAFSKLNWKLRVLNLGNNEVTANGTRLLVEALPAFGALQELFLYHNPDIGLRGGVALSRLLSMEEGIGLPSLQRLIVSVCGLGDTGTQAIAGALRGNDRLRELDVSGNGATDAAMHSIAEVITVNRTLEILNLSLNCIGRSGLQELLDGASHRWDHTDSHALKREELARVKIDVSTQADLLGAAPLEIDVGSIDSDVLTLFVGLTP